MAGFLTASIQTIWESLQFVFFETSQQIYSLSLYDLITTNLLFILTKFILNKFVLTPVHGWISDLLQSLIPSTDVYCLCVSARILFLELLIAYTMVFAVLNFIFHKLVRILLAFLRFPPLKMFLQSKHSSHILILHNLIAKQ